MAARMVRVKGNGLIVTGSVSDDVMERVRSESGSESYVMMTSRGNETRYQRNEAVHEAVHVMGVSGYESERPM